MNGNSLCHGNNQDATWLYITRALLCKMSQDQQAGAMPPISLCHKDALWFKSIEDIVIAGPYCICPALSPRNQSCLPVFSGVYLALCIPTLDPSLHFLPLTPW